MLLGISDVYITKNYKDDTPIKKIIKLQLFLIINKSYQKEVVLPYTML